MPPHWLGNLINMKKSLLAKPAGFLICYISLEVKYTARMKSQAAITQMA